MNIIFLSIVLTSILTNWFIKEKSFICIFMVVSLLWRLKIIHLKFNSFNFKRGKCENCDEFILFWLKFTDFIDFKTVLFKGFSEWIWFYCNASVIKWGLSSQDNDSMLFIWQFSRLSYFIMLKLIWLIFFNILEWKTYFLTGLKC